MAPEPMIAIFNTASLYSLRIILVRTPVPTFRDDALVRSHAPPQRRDVGPAIGLVLHDRLATRKLIDLLQGHAARLEQLRDVEVIVHEGFARHPAHNKI